MRHTIVEFVCDRRMVGVVWCLCYGSVSAPRLEYRERQKQNAVEID